ncbi:MAG: hypothetical protein AAF665_15710 [Pseudomonadota bacterium]
MDRDQKILDYFQNRLTERDRKAFEAAMTRDPSLTAEVNVMRAVRAELASAPGHDSAAAVWDRLSAEIDAAPHAANDNRRLWQELLKYAAVAMISVAVWQLTIGPRVSVAPDGFRTAGEQPAGFTFQVKFVDTATLVDISALIAPLGGTISDGPTALGLVHLSFADEHLRDEAIRELEGRRDLVEFVAE